MAEATLAGEVLEIPRPPQMLHVEGCGSKEAKRNASWKPEYCRHLGGHSLSP